MTLYQLIEMYGLNPADFKIVRHSYKGLDSLATFRSKPELFNAYQSFQKASGGPNFDKAKTIAVFCSYHGTQALFLGLWQVGKKVPSIQSPHRQRELVESLGFDLSDMAYYELTPIDELADLSERLVVEWGKATVSWIQKRDKEVVSILPKAQVREFVSYEHAVVAWPDLVRMVRDPTANFTWMNALKAVNGIYCITNIDNGNIYVGSAYGRDGLWGRWLNYVATGGRGGNEKLVEAIDRDPGTVDFFQFSILEILPGSCTADDAVAKENLWKDKLGSRIGGYNSN